MASICTLTHCQPLSVIQTHESFRQQPAQFIIRYDAPLTGLGVGLYEVMNNRLVIYTALQLPFTVDNDSSNQNTMEFTAVVLGLLLAWRAKLSNFHYDLHGDNRSSLAWAKADRVTVIVEQ